MNGITYVCPGKDIVCGNRPENWCAICPQRPQVAVAPHAAAGPYPTAMRPATDEEVRRMRAPHPDTARLDWLEQQGSPHIDCYTPAMGGPTTYIVREGAWGRSLGYSLSLREAIDVARGVKGPTT